MKKYLFVVLVIFVFYGTCMGGQTYTNADLKKYDRYKSNTNTNNYRPATKYEHYSTNPATISTAYSASANRKRYNNKILLAKEELRKIERQIKNLERKIQFHSRMKDSREVTNTCRTEIKKLHDRSKSIQNNINDLNLLQAGADPDQVISNRQAARNAERAQEVRGEKDFSDGIEDAIVGIPPRSYSGQYYDGYLSQITSSHSSGENDARIGLPPKSHGGPYYSGYLSQNGKNDAMRGIPPKSYGGQYYDGYLPQSQNR